MEIGEKIKKFRLERNMKQSDLAEKAHISRVAIGNYERGDRKPNVETLNKIANALDVSINDLLGINENSSLGTKMALYRNNNIPPELFEIQNDFPEGVDVLMRATVELTPAQKEKMIELMNLFLDTIEEGKEGE